MSFVPEAGTPLAAYYAETQPRTGAVLTRRSLGTLDADIAAARAAGYANVDAPPNLLAAMVEWGVGTPESQLGSDGTPDAGDIPLADGLRVMGAGEEMELVNPAVAGTEIVLETTLESITPKRTRAGTCVFVTTLNTFPAGYGTVLNCNRRTVVLLDTLEES